MRGTQVRPRSDCIVRFDTECTRNEERSGNHEVRNLDPSQLSIAQQTQRVTGDIETRADGHLDQAENHVERAGDDATH